MVEALWALWSELRIDDWFDDTTVAGVAAESAAQVIDGLKKQQKASRSYARTMLRQAGVKLPKQSAPELIYPRHDVLITDVYQRPAESFRWKMRQTAGDVKAAWDAAEDRLDVLVDTDLRLVANREERDTYAAVGTVTGYRRIIHPELTASGTCGLCVVAADRVYKLSELQPIHDRCVCTTAPIIGENDPGLDLNGADLRRIYAAGGGNTRKELKNIRLKDITHGEIGPILGRDGQEIKVLKEFRENTKKDQAQLREEQIKVAKDWIEALEAANKTGKPVTRKIGSYEIRIKPSVTALKYQKDLLGRLSKLAA